MAKVFDVYQNAIARGKEKGILSADIRIIIAHIQNYLEQIDVVLRKDDEMKDEVKFEECFSRLLNGEPVEYIINQATFFNRKLYVDKNVLIPRQETSELIATLSEKITQWYEPRNYLVVADIGTGSGAISLALKDFFPNWLVTASDVSKDALDVARRNFKDAGVNITTLQGDSLEPFINANMNLDIIVSNPPYILNKDEVAQSVKDYEPELALYLDKNDSVYEKIFKDYKKVKKEALLMCFEIGYDLVPYLTSLMEQYLTNYEYEFIKDLNGLDRFLFIYCK